MNDELMELPKGWITTKLGECLRLINGRAYLRHELLDQGTPIIRIQNLNGGDKWFYSDLQLDRDKYCDKGDLLFAWSATFGPFIWQGSCSIYHYHIWKIEPFEVIDQKFAYYLLEKITQAVKAAAHGVAMPHMTKQGMENWQIQIPPLNEQKRIVAKIEELRERSQKARSHLSAIPNLCDKFRQSVLAAAFRGDLTADWREQNPDVEPASVLLERIRRDRHDRKSPESVDSSQLPELPEGWMWTPLEEIASHRSGIAFKSAEFTNIGIQVIRLSNVYKGQLDLTRDPVFLPDKYAIDSFTLKANDIVVSQTGTRFKRDYGNFVLIPNNCPKLFLNQRLLAVSCHHLINPEYIVFASKLKSYQDHFFSHETGGVNQGNVGVSGVMKGLVPLAPQKEAQILVKRIKTAFEYICRVELIHRRNEDNLNYLDRSILAKAFQGELVEQDPNDEPASVLLDRIRAEREQQAQGKKGKRIMKTTST